MKKRICIDAGHGLGNRTPNVYDPGACHAGHEEATIALQWATELERQLKALGCEVVMTRLNRTSKAPLKWRTLYAADRKCDLFISLHLNASDGQGHGTETFYRHKSSQAIAQRVNDGLVASLGTKDRKVKTEEQSARKTIHVLGFKPDSILVELGFIDDTSDRTRLLDPASIRLGCEAIAKAITQ